MKMIKKNNELEYPFDFWTGKYDVEFTITEAHLKVIQRHYWFVDKNRSAYSTKHIYTLDYKKPTGNSAWERDIIEMNGWGKRLKKICSKCTATEEDHEYCKHYDIKYEKLEQKARIFYHECIMALQICMKLLKFETGIYYKASNEYEFTKIKEVEND
jgi:hypothetical protein